MMSRINGILSFLQGCNSMDKLQKIHVLILVNGYQENPAISNKLLNFCAISVSGSLAYARLLFNQIKNPGASAWNSMIRGYSQSPSPLEAIFYYNKMMFEGQSRPDEYTFSFLLKACEKAKAEKKCRETHGLIIRTGYTKHVIVGTNLMRSYAGNALIEIAQLIFYRMTKRDLVSWNSMIACYSQAALHYEALKIYSQMRISNVGLDAFTLVSLLSSCAHVGALDFGIQMHRFANENGFMDNVFVGNALIDMYAKCGSLDGARQVFAWMQRRDIFTWNSMIFGLGVHGHGDEAILLFRKMLVTRIQPNSVTFLGLLCGCSHQGLIEEGIRFFHMMTSDFNLKPGIKHYGCIVDLYGRGGKLEKALEIIRSLPTTVDDPVLWRTLLGACKIHRNMEIGEVAMSNLVRLDGLNAGDCVLLARIYAEAKDQEGVARMRKLIRSQRILTTPGWSWIEVDDKVHRFVVGDKSHCESEEIYMQLKEIIHRVTMVGYVEEEALMHESGSAEESSESSAFYHSERLAIAFGLARTPQGTSLRIVKNLRVCRDCHSFTKFVSKAFDREIIVRDRVRFHHFKDGLCSCKDYW